RGRRRARLTPGRGHVEDIAGFLGSHPPFDAVDADELARIAAVTEPEVTPRGKAIFAQGAGPVESVWVVRSGSVEVIHDGRVLDLLGPGELFGQASMISGLPTGFEARAGEDTVCYRIPADVVRPLLARPDVLAFVARSIVSRPPPIAPPPADPGQRRVAALIRRPPLQCPGDAPIRAAAQRMTAAGASAVLVRRGAAVGIVTDSDLRSRVIAAGLSPDEPVSAVMTEPAYTVGADRLGGDVLLDMLERNIHHIPVLSPAGEVLGVVDDGDLVAAEGRMPLLLRRAIGLAQTQADLAAAAAGLNPALVALRDAQVPAEQVAAVRSVVLDALIRRLAEQAVGDAGPPPVPFTWFALGSLARREAVPSSDVDSALAWQGDGARDDAGDDAEAAGYGQRLAGAVNDGLRACGLPPDANGANAANPLFARSLASWQAVERSLSEDPTQAKALILASLITDSRPVFSTGTQAGGGLWQVPTDRPDLRRLLAQFALSFRPPTGFWREFVVEHSGERRGQLDLKHGGLIPIVDLARWAGMGAGMTSGSTMDRLRAAEAAGTMEGPEARTLMEAFGFIFSLRLDHQVEQLRRGEPPDDFIDPKQLNPLARSYLREAFRAVASVQAGLAAELSLGVRWG
ncbi:MAG TPA: putative nucleotidyltransferase substrate binding domain-containing protein, partial [Streptosporangiaceae bacterium]|nr:putative nucleotidyltransferase substrate binding domain-containing protein [Streptosporangiaceae bacterium]